jgi:tetratricopeptide (TPR) repeat protein
VIALVTVFALHLVAAAPTDPVALSREAARAEQEYRYADAFTLYTRILKDAPGSYVARTAQVRSQELGIHADAGFVPYARFQRMLNDYTKAGGDASIAKAREILAQYPEASVAPEVQFWIGNEYREVRRDPDSAMVEFEALVKKYPASPFAPMAMDRMGRMLEGKKKFSEAEALYENMQRLYPNAATPRAYAERRQQVKKNIRRKQLAVAAWAIVGVSAVLFLIVGGWRFDKQRWKSYAKSKIGFAFFVGLAPSAYLWATDGLWSPSLTTLGFAFAFYGCVLAALPARTRIPQGAGWAPIERIFFNILAPLAMLYLVVHYFKFWEAFYL